MKGLRNGVRLHREAHGLWWVLCYYSLSNTQRVHWQQVPLLACMPCLWARLLLKWCTLPPHLKLQVA